MGVRVTSLMSRAGLLRTLVSHARLALRLIREPRVPLLMKALPIAAVAYVISPLDFVPDVIPILGQLDDLGILLLGLESFLRFCPASAVTFHRDAIAEGRRYTPMSATDGFIDAEWHRAD
jgi:uncharacterized membrane protein YkvA (DUF1232 family)